MKRIVSKAFKHRGITKEMIISDETWLAMIKNGTSAKYEAFDMPQRPLKEVPAIEKPEEVKKKSKPKPE